MNPYFAMNPNDDEEEQQPNAFNVDDESDIYFRRRGVYFGCWCYGVKADMALMCRGISIQCPEASASPLRSIPAEGLILKQPMMSQPTEDTSSDGLLSDGNLQLTHSVSCKAEAISPLMNVLQSRVSLTKVHQRLELP
ncbi:hypothetical protein Tco_1250897 [Tanacetum coccineum]